MATRHPIQASSRRERGQTTVEWTGLLLLVSLALAAGIAGLGAAVPGGSLARSIVEKLVCAARLELDACSRDALVAAYGSELAGAVREFAPTFLYEKGMEQVPVDFRRCREVECAVAPGEGEIQASDTGEPVTAFVHVVDCRPNAATGAGGEYDCSGERAGRVYLQYWAYYPDSQTMRWLLGDLGHHADDFESYQVRLGPGEAEVRASSHHGYTWRGGVTAWPTDVGLVERAAWGERGDGKYYISDGSHAGAAHKRNFYGSRLLREHVLSRFRDLPRRYRDLPGIDLPKSLLTADEDMRRRFTRREDLRLVPLEPLAARAGRRHEFSVTPVWRKRVWFDPEHK